ncbi:unnamed protein product [Effrenium voratum]|nr:unnamed protein product [Effrenium voratum]
MGKPGVLDAFQVYYQCRLAELHIEGKVPRATTPQDCYRRRNPGALQPLRPCSSEADVRPGRPRSQQGQQDGTAPVANRAPVARASMSAAMLWKPKELSESKSAWAKTPGRASVSMSNPGSPVGREKRSSLERGVSTHEQDHVRLTPEEEAPTEEEERALALLQRCSFFKTLEPAVLLELPRLASFTEAPKGAVVFRQGDPPSNCWLIAKGEVGFYIGSGGAAASPWLPCTPGHENTWVPWPWEEKSRVGTLDGQSTISLQSNLGKCVNKARSGAVFGELALMEDNCIRKASAKCHTNCEFMTLPASAFRIAKARLVQFREAKMRFLNKYIPGMEECPQPGPNDPPHPSFFFNRLRVHEDYIFLKQGERDSRAIYVIYKGNVHLKREKENGPEVCQRLLPGHLFGSWIHHAVEPLSAVAATACEVWYVKASDIKYLPEHLLKAIQDRLSTEYANLLKSVLVDRRFGWDQPLPVQAAKPHTMDDGERWAEQILHQVQNQEMRTQFFAASIGADLVNRKWRH